MDRFLLSQHVHGLFIQDGFPPQILVPPVSHDLDLEPVFPQTSGVSETIRATLLPRSWNGDPRTAVNKYTVLYRSEANC